MTTEERNNWILENNDKIVECLSRYCERNPELNYEELYSDTMVYLITYLDDKGIPEYGLTTLVGNYVHSVLKTKKEIKEIPVDYFELIFLQDFDFESSAIVKAIVSRSKLGDREIEIVKEIAVDGYTFEQAAKKHNRSKSVIRRHYVDSIMRLRMAAIALRYRLYS